jgi:hypothetical protein
MNTNKIVFSVAAAALAVSIAACQPTDQPDTLPAPPDAPSSWVQDATPSLTKSQENAIGSAESYLRYSGFSRAGLIDQLEYEQYSPTDAEFAVAHLEQTGQVDWFAEAVESAESYLDYTSFSRAGLIDQLIYEEYTPEQAEHAVSEAGL